MFVVAVVVVVGGVIAVVVLDLADAVSMVSVDLDSVSGLNKRCTLK